MPFLKEEHGSTPIGAAEAWLHADMGCILSGVDNNENMGGMRQHNCVQTEHTANCTAWHKEMPNMRMKQGRTPTRHVSGQRRRRRGKRREEVTRQASDQLLPKQQTKKPTQICTTCHCVESKVKDIGL